MPLFLVLLALLVALRESMANSAPQWGTLRPHALISARLPIPNSPHLGFVYHPVTSTEIRHLAEHHRDKIQSFSWTRHDSTFGEQTIRDKDANLLITTSFLPDASSLGLSLRVAATPLDPSKPVTPTSLVFYAATGPDDVRNMKDDPPTSKWGTVDLTVDPAADPSAPVVLNLSSPVLPSDLPIVLHPPTGGELVAPSALESSLSSSSGSGSRSQLRARAARPAVVPDDVAAFRPASFSFGPVRAWAIERQLERLLSASSRAATGSSSMFLLPPSWKNGKNAASGMLVQRILSPPFQIDVAAGDAPVGHKLDEALEKHRSAFDARFEEVFALRKRGLSEDEILFAREALANVLGGIGFFHGSSIAADEEGQEEPSMLPPVSLLTATPSRVVFPRGFLWDEGFHQLIVMAWDPKLSKRCLASWFNASHESGWIPREQILGTEARARFPEHVRHLMIQNPKAANPPTILIPLQILWQSISASNSKCSADDVSCKHNNQVDPGSFAHMFERVDRYYHWLRKSQAGSLHNSFRWRGRSLQSTSKEGYPLTLSSGLDDYPRGSYPSDDERHVDLHAWVTWAARMLARIAEIEGRDASEYWQHYKELKADLLKYHGTPVSKSSTYTDLMLCDFDGEKRACHEGYVTILPMLLGLLDSDDQRLSVILDALEDPNRLRARAGVRSLSKGNKWYRKGDDYWTGSVWMPFNYLTLASLKTKYSVEEGPYRERARKVYEELRKSVLGNSFSEYSRTGQLWENYSPEDDGNGKSGRQFTGWSSLVLLIYVERFDGLA